MPAEWTDRTVDGPAADLLSAPEVARLFHISEDTLNRLVADGEFPEPLTVGKKTRLWYWKAVAYYRLRLEMTARLKPVSTAVDRS